MKKKIGIIFMIVMLLFLLTNVALATGSDPYAKIQNEPIDSTASLRIKSTINMIIGILQLIGVTSAVVVLIILGMKYMTSSPSGKAEIKTHAKVYIVGIILLFSFTGILQLIKRTATDVSNIVVVKTEEHEE